MFCLNVGFYFIVSGLFLQVFVTYFCQFTMDGCSYGAFVIFVFNCKSRVYVCLYGCVTTVNACVRFTVFRWSAQLPDSSFFKFPSSSSHVSKWPSYKLPSSVSEGPRSHFQVYKFPQPKVLQIITYHFPIFQVFQLPSSPVPSFKFPRSPVTIFQGSHVPLFFQFSSPQVSSSRVFKLSCFQVQFPRSQLPGILQAWWATFVCLCGFYTSSFETFIKDLFETSIYSRLLLETFNRDFSRDFIARLFRDFYNACVCCIVVHQLFYMVPLGSVRTCFQAVCYLPCGMRCDMPTSRLYVHLMVCLLSRDVSVPEMFISFILIRVVPSFSLRCPACTRDLFLHSLTRGTLRLFFMLYVTRSALRASLSARRAFVSSPSLVFDPCFVSGTRLLVLRVVHWYRWCMCTSGFVVFLRPSSLLGCPLLSRLCSFVFCAIWKWSRIV